MWNDATAARLRWRALGCATLSPFLLSFVLLGVSPYLRIKMQESPLFSKLKTAGALSRNPLKESFTNRVNLRYVLIALFGATAGQGVVWYTGQFARSPSCKAY